MYYITKDKNKLIAYNEQVTASEGYSGTTMMWACICEHQNGVDFAIVKNEKYSTDLEEVETLPFDWYPNDEEIEL